MKADQILSKAAAHMLDRAAIYDKPEGERSMGRAVQAFNAITGRDLSEPEGWLLMQVLKDVRLFQREGYHADSAEDCVAYAALKAEAKSVNEEAMWTPYAQIDVVKMNDILPLAGISKDEYQRRHAAGIAKARAEGRFKGKGVDTEKHALIERMLTQGVSWSKICAAVPCSRSTITRVADALKKGDAGVTGEKPWYPDGRKWVEVPDCQMNQLTYTSVRMSILQRHHRENRNYIHQFSQYAHSSWWNRPIDDPARIVAYTLDEHEPWYPDDRHWIEVPDDCMESPLAEGLKCSILCKAERDSLRYDEDFSAYGCEIFWSKSISNIFRIVAYTTEAPHAS